MRRKKNSIYTTKKKERKKSTLRCETLEFLTEMRDWKKEKKKAGGNSCGEVRDWQRLKGRKKEEWKRLDALGAVFSPLHLSPNLPSWRLLNGARQQSVGRWQSLQLVVVVSTRRPKRGTSLCADLWSAADDDHGVWPVSAPPVFPSSVCSDAETAAASVLLTLRLQLPNTALVPRRSSFSFFLPSLSHSVPSISLSLLPAAASPKHLKLRRCSKYFPSSPLSLLLAF